MTKGINKDRFSENDNKIERTGNLNYTSTDIHKAKQYKIKVL